MHSLKNWHKKWQEGKACDKGIKWREWWSPFRCGLVAVKWARKPRPPVSESDSMCSIMVLEVEMSVPGRNVPQKRPNFCAMFEWPLYTSKKSYRHWGSASKSKILKESVTTLPSGTCGGKETGVFSSNHSQRVLSTVVCLPSLRKYPSFVRQNVSRSSHTGSLSRSR